MENEKAPLISIVIPLYNKEDYIRSCIESLAAQTFSDIEVIIVDDGSTDGSTAIVRRTCRTNPKFIYLRQENAGVSAALNTGIAQARGTYIVRMDADDWAEPTMLELLYKTARTYDVPLVRCGIIREFANGKTRAIPCTKTLMETTGLWCFNRLFGKIDRAFMTACATLYHRRLLDDTTITFSTELTNLEDMLFNARIFSLDTSIVLLPEDLYHYRQTGDSLSEKTFIELPEQLGIFETLMQRYVLSRQPDLADVYSKYRGTAFLTTAASMSTFGVDGMKALKESAMFDALVATKDGAHYPPPLLRLMQLLGTEKYQRANLLTKQLFIGRAAHRVIRAF